MGGGEDSSDEDSISSPSILYHAKVNKRKQKELLKKKKRAKQQAKHIYLQDYDEDPYFVLLCLLSDLKATRAYIKEVWHEYYNGTVDLITASLTTNATFDIIRTYEDDFPGLSSLLRDYSKTMKLVLSRSLNNADEACALQP